VVAELCNVGAPFKAINEMVFNAPLDFIGIFVAQTKPLEHCVVAFVCRGN